jgi:iron(III) transport system permease protein
VKPWRLVIASILFALIGVPLTLPIVQLLRDPEAWQVWRESGRLLELAENTAFLVGGTLALTVPLGIAGAVLLYRSDLPLARPLRVLTLLALFVPLPLFASAWQATLGAGGWLMTLGWLPDSGRPWQPWTLGIGAAIWVHALAALPWVVWIVGQGLCWVERDLEEDALLSASPWQVLLHVTLPRCRAAIVMAALVVAVQTATEITVTDLMQVRTFAEEVYTQFVLQDRDVLARAVALSLPSVLVLGVLLIYAGQRWERNLPPLEQVGPPLCLFSLGKARWPALAIVLAAVAALVLVPVLALSWKAGLGGSPEVWSAGRFEHALAFSWEGKRGLIGENLLLGAVVGAIGAGLALLTCWLAVDSRWFRTAMLMLAAVAWATPGPVVGIGLKEAILQLMEAEDALVSFDETMLQLTNAGDYLPHLSRMTPPLRTLLYEGPSLLPLIWGSLIRFFPVAVAVVWPAVRQIPVELKEAARVDGASPVAEFFGLTVPLTAPMYAWAATAVAVLTLGELSAGKLVETPGSTTLAHVIFEQMHRGVPSDVAALGLILLMVVSGMAGLAAIGLAAFRRTASSAALPRQ